MSELRRASVTFTAMPPSIHNIQQPSEHHQKNCINQSHSNNNNQLDDNNLIIDNNCDNISNNDVVNNTCIDTTIKDVATPTHNNNHNNKSCNNNNYNTNEENDDDYVQDDEEHSAAKIKVPVNANDRKSNNFNTNDNSNNSNKNKIIINNIDDDDVDLTEDFQISLAPYIQTYLTQTGRRHSCCSVMLPVAFERAAPKSWLDPRFDSAVLEGQYQASIFPQIRLRFRFALCYILICSLVWMLYFLLNDKHVINLLNIIFFFLFLFSIIILCFLLTYTNIYRLYKNVISCFIATFITILSIIFLLLSNNLFSQLGHFAICIEIILLIYTMIPLPLWLCSCITIIYSILFELLCYLLNNNYDQEEKIIKTGSIALQNNFVYKILAVRILLQLCIHLVGVHVLIMNVVRMRGTFMKVGQNLLVRRQLEMEKQLKEKMIHSVMPPKVADMLLKEAGPPSVDMTEMGNGSYQNNRQRRSNDFKPRSSNDVKSLFRPFHMHSMENVSILFADIVGFTKMSSTKTAEQLVEILNDLFERFDDLCVLNGCEKISTLGDCYYCVSGCPEPRPDHGICCVEMGLGMIAAMRAFDAQRHEGVKMRVGVHTGTVLCGIVGTRRVKFDVWSNDVTLANRMESTGRPEQVHISGETCSFLGDGYILEEGEEVFGHRTYFVLGRKRDLLGSANVSQSDLSSLLPPIDQGLTLHVPRLNNAAGDGFTNSVQLSQSATNLSAIHPNVPPASPVGLSNSLNPSPVMQHRTRISSLNKVTKFLTTGGGNHVSVVPSHNGNGEAKMISKYQQPKIIVTAKSLPGSLDSDADEDLCCKRGESRFQNKDESLDETNKISTNKPITKFKYWKIPKFMRKIDSSLNSSVAENKKVIGEEIDRKVATIISEETVPCLDQNGGYQQLPVVIETPRPSHCTLEIPSRLMIASPVTVRAASSSQHPDSNSPAASHSMFDDIIDVRSYISQSRSDISPFARSGSYRSQCGRSPQGEISPTGRPRSSTIAAARFCEIPMPWADGASLCASAASRKDSGIRSNSRRSSIQQQIYAINQNVATNQQRVSGYFTSSQSSLTGIPPEPVTAPPPQHPDPLAACLQQLRKQSDLQLIRCVRDNARSQRSYLVKPPVSDITLFFKSRQMENDFRSKAHRFGSENEIEGPPTLATPRYNTYIDILTGVIVYLSISAALFLLLPTQFAAPYRAWVCLFVVFTSIQLFALFLSTKQMCRTKRQRRKSTATATTQLTSVSSCSDNIFEIVSGWYLWHLCGALLMSLPVIAVLINFLLIDINNIKSYEYHYGLLLFICIIHFCNFTQLNFWMRNFLSLLAGLWFILIAIMHFHHIQITIDSFKMVATSTTMPMDENPVNSTVVFANKPDKTDIYNYNIDITNMTSRISSFDAEYLINLTDNKIYENKHQKQLENELRSEQFLKNFHNFGKYQIEILIDLILLLILVWFLNREFEIGYRLTFYGNAVANQDKIRVQNMKNQADILLHNIIPKHVAEQLKNTAKYSENHKNVGIIFASIINFNEMYDESYLGGKEYLRVLNELIGDFDELLSRYEFRCVEKIKTIGSTFMAASGLDPSNRGDNGEHLFALIDFALAMQQVVDSFNKDLLEFNLILRIGYNVGEVTAGVIGTSKLYYDIWGDAVNVASRMDSTGLPGRIQVGGGAYLKLLEQRYNFESRGQVYVKGKDHMEVFLLIGPKPDDFNDDLIQESNSLIHNS